MQPEFPILPAGTTPSGFMAPSATAVQVRRALLTGVVVFAVFGGLAAGVALAPEARYEPEFVMLIRFMAVMKAAIIVACVALIAWRLKGDIAPSLAAAYIAAVGLMAIAPGLIWSLAALPVASAFFYAGLLVGLALAAADGYARRRRGEPATPARLEHI
jgi:hypothetical protein